MGLLNFVLCLFLFVGLSVAAKCPTSPPLTQNVDYERIKGPWILAASDPVFDEKCKNLTFSEGTEFRLRERLFDSTENYKLKTNNYLVKKQVNSPIISLENVCTQDKIDLFLVDGDYDNYIIIYSCDDSTGSASEAWEIWSRGVKYEALTILPNITNTLSRLNLNPTDFSYTTISDCTH